MKKILSVVLLLFCQINFAQNEFITVWKTDNPGNSGNTQIKIPTEGVGYNYSVDWGDGNFETNLTGDAIHTYSNSGTYTVKITGDFPRIYFNNQGDKDKILSVEQWGINAWSSMKNAFNGCSNLVINAIDVPDLSNVTSLRQMFRNCTSFNQNIGGWDVSTITEMDGMFRGCSNFNQPIGDWDVGSVQDMEGMFNEAISFNRPIGDWDVSNATEIHEMFLGASSFNQDIRNWDVSGANSMSKMFEGASSFDQNIGDWDVSEISNFENMFNGVELSLANYDSLLIGWNSNDDPNGSFNTVTFHGGFSQYCSQEALIARDSLINVHNWNITDNGQNTNCLEPLDIDENGSVVITVTPNPTSSYIEIQLSEKMNGLLVLLDPVGRTLERQSMEGWKDYYIMEVSKYASGVYYVEVQGEQFTRVKVLIQ